MRNHNIVQRSFSFILKTKLINILNLRLIYYIISFLKFLFLWKVTIIILWLILKLYELLHHIKEYSSINFLYQAIIFRNRTFTQLYVYRKNIFYINTIVRMNLTCYIEIKFERQFFFPRNQVLKEPFKLQ